MIKRWYAVQEDKNDAWDNWTFDYFEAEEMLLRQGKGLIAVIKNDFCIKEITYDDICTVRMLLESL